MHVFTHVGTFVMHVMRALLWRSLTKLEQKYDQLYKKSHHKQDCPMCVKDFNYDKSFTQIKKHTLDKLSKPPAPLTFLWGFFFVVPYFIIWNWWLRFFIKRIAFFLFPEEICCGWLLITVISYDNFTSSIKSRKISQKTLHA